MFFSPHRPASPDTEIPDLFLIAQTLVRRLCRSSAIHFPSHLLPFLFHHLPDFLPSAYWNQVPKEYVSPSLLSWLNIKLLIILPALIPAGQYSLHSGEPIHWGRSFYYECFWHLKTFMSSVSLNHADFPYLFMTYCVSEGWKVPSDWHFEWRFGAPHPRCWSAYPACVPVRIPVSSPGGIGVGGFFQT